VSKPGAPFVITYKEAFALGNSATPADRRRADAHRRVDRRPADPDPHPERSVTRREGWKRAPVVAGMALISASALFPLYFMASHASRTNADYDESKVGLPSVFSFDTLQRAWEGASIPTYMRNSLLVVAGTVLLSIVVASMAGYSFSKLRWRPRSAVYLFVLAWIAVPPLILLVPLYVEMVDLGLRHPVVGDPHLQRGEPAQGRGAGQSAWGARWPARNRRCPALRGRERHSEFDPISRSTPTD
jgi:hypothetical protein